ncbi:MAG: hypothetical protein QOG54_432 [Actinomycetota bacterium]|jgi:hypothetical protein|nr:hypothetical protein [Actinomycetota bacterium]
MGAWRRHGSETGASLVEMLTAIALGAILVSLSFGALRHFWRVNSLEGAQGELTTQFRRLHQQAVTGDEAEVYGAVFEPGSDSWDEIRFSPNGPGPADDECVAVGEPHPLSGGLVGTSFVGAGVTIEYADFTPVPDGTPEKDKCAGLDVVDVGSETIFFYRRGNATGGVVGLYQEAMDRTLQVQVSSLTGSVVEVR